MAVRVAMHAEKDVFERFVRGEDREGETKRLELEKLEALGKGPVVEKSLGSE